MVKIATIARIELKRMLRDRSNIFFVFVFPLLLVVLIGAQFGGSVDVRLGFVDAGADTAAADLRDRLDARDGLSVRSFDDAAQLRDEVARGLISAGIVVAGDYGDELRALAPTTIEFVGRPDATAASLRAVVQAEVTELTLPAEAVVLVQRVHGDERGGTEALLATADELRAFAPGIDVDAQVLGTDELGEEFAGLGQFDLGASSQLFLFTFLTALTGGAALIQSREYGVATRMIGTPTAMGTVVAGFAGGRLLIALTQALYIVLATVLLFGVNWGAPVASATVILAFCAVAAAAGLLLGAVFTNDSQASGAGVGLGIGLAALGGSMIPLELFPDGMAVVARFTPHAWANEAMAELVRRDGGLADVAGHVAVLLGMAGVLGALGTWRLRRVLTR
jgi:ABC-2 type transport system permease protein